MAPYYVSEIAETSMRGALASLMQLMVTFGVLFVNALNIYDTVHWVTISGICIGIPGKKVFLLPNYYQFYSNAKCGQIFLKVAFMHQRFHNPPYQ